MAENLTQVNSYQDKLLEAMSIVSSQLISSISYDKTITCTIIDDKDKDKGKYKVTNGDATFDAYSSDTKLKIDDVVYVTIPEGNYDNQKIIQGKKTSDNEKPFVFITPSDTFLDITDNLVERTTPETGDIITKPIYNKIALPIGLVANEIQGNQKVIKKNIFTASNLETEKFLGYTRLLLKANFSSWIPEAISGNYGLQITVTDNLNATTNDDHTVDNIAQTKVMLFDCSEMYGNPYNFESFYEQQVVFDISDLNTITDISVDFYQIGESFYDVNKKLLPFGENIENNEFSIFPNNLFVDNLYIGLGYDVSEITDEYIVSVINDSITYSEYRESELNKKEIDLRWVHQFEDGPLVVNPERDFDLNKETAQLKDCEIRWYRYKLGAAAADEYCGVYWTGLTVTKDGDKYLLSDWDGKLGETQALENVIFSPDTSYQTEQIKAIIYLNGIAIRGPVITFRNEQPKTGEDVSNFLNALEIECVDNTLGNYLIYNEAGNILNTADSQLERKLKCNFAETGAIAKSELLLDYEKGDTISWKFPIKNSMVSIQRCGKSNTDKYEVINLTSEIYVSNTYFIKKDDVYELAIGNFDSQETYYKHSLIAETIQLNKVWIQLQEYKENFDELTVVEHFKEDGSRDYYAYEKDGVEYYKHPTLNQYDKYYEPWNIYKDSSQNYLILQNERTLHYNEDTKITSILYPTYKISAMYSMYNMNNTIACTIRKDRMIYTTEKEFTFGVSGTMGSDKSLVVDFVGGHTAIIANDTTTAYQLEVKMYDENNKPEDLSGIPITWSWYAPGGDIVANNLSFVGNGTSVISLQNNGLNIGNANQIYIAKVAVGEDGAELETYFPIPIKSSEEYSHINGATSVIYLSNNQPDYYKGDYQLYVTNDNAVGSPDIQMLSTNKVTWECISQESGTSFIANVASNGKDGLKPIAVYTSNVKNYAIVALHNGEIVWQQPILVLRNNYPSRVINKWDGKTLTIDEEMGTILSTSIAAGRKEIDNTFTGVMLGDWSGTSSDESLTKNTGVYGFHHGAMSYAFKDDGTGFIGKDAVGRIEFDGNEATITSSNYTEPTSSSSGSGMKIDFNGKSHTDENGKAIAPFIKMYGAGGKIILDTKAGTTGYPFEIGDKFKAKWDGHIIANSGLIGGWQLQEVTRDVDNKPIKGGKFIADVSDPSAYWGKIELDPLTNTISGGKLRASIFESVNTQPIKLGGAIAVYDPSKKINVTNPHTSISEEHVDYSAAGGVKGGILGFVQQNTGSEADFQTAGIGFTAEGGAEVKATTANVGMSIGTNYLYLSKDAFQVHTYGKSYKFDKDGKIIPDTNATALSSLSFDGYGLSAQTGVARIILQTQTSGSDDPHAGMGFGSNYFALYYSRAYYRAPSSIEFGSSGTGASPWLILGSLDTQEDMVAGVKKVGVQISNSGQLIANKTLLVQSNDDSGTLLTDNGTKALDVVQSGVIQGRLAIGQTGVGTQTLYVNGTVYASGLTTLNNGLTVNNGYTLNGGGSINGTLTLGSTTTANSTLTVSGKLTANGGVDFSGSASQVGIKAQFA